jgi:hypothetical protein
LIRSFQPCRARAHTPRVATSLTRSPPRTVSTARYRCSTSDICKRQSGPRSRDARKHHAIKKPNADISWDASVKHQPGTDKLARAVGRENLHYAIKAGLRVAALRPPGGRHGTSSVSPSAKVDTSRIGISLVAPRRVSENRVR